MRGHHFLKRVRHSLLDCVAPLKSNGGADIGSTHIHIRGENDIRDIISKQAVAFLTLPQHLLHLLALRNITHYSQHLILPNRNKPSLVVPCLPIK